MTLPVVFTANGPSGYNLTKSLRFRSSASSYLNRTPASAGNQKTWTWSGWVKRGKIDAESTFFACVASGTSDATYLQIGFTGTSNSQLYVAGYSVNWRATTALYRDTAAWYHIMIVLDTTNATANNRVRVYVNGSEVTSFAQLNNPSLNQDLSINRAASHVISSRTGYSSDNFFDGYMAEVNFIDGQALTPSSFGSTNSLTGVWQPAKYTGTYGTNGFYLPFTNTTSTTTLGYDFSGNGNNWTTNNISLTSGSTYDSMTDVPTLTSATTANTATINPLDYVNSNTGSLTATNGNLLVTRSTTAYGGFPATIALPTSGKFAFEFTASQAFNGSTNEAYFGIGVQSNGTFTNSSASGTVSDYYTAVNITGGTGAVYKKFSGGSSTSHYAGTGAVGSGDVFQFLVDMTNGTIDIKKNGSTYGTQVTGLPTTIPLYPYISMYGSVSMSVNFGQQPWNSTPTSGYVALNTYNLPTSTIVKGNTVMDATLYTGDNTSPKSITNTASFKPDFVWVKDRSSAYNHTLWDSVRGVGSTKGLSSNSTDPEGLGVALGSTAANGYVSALNSNGFQVTTGSSTNVYVNTSPDAYVAWQWQAGQGVTSSNTSGSITSTVSVNTTAGFSVVTYTGNGTAGATVGHGLGVAPSMIIVKNRSTTGDWEVYTSMLGATKSIYLNLTNASTTSTVWNNTAPTSSVFTLGGSSTPNGSGNSLVAYCWAEIAGFSKFGSYTGNGSTDGTFIYLGFRPKYLLVKLTSSAGDPWVITDSSRSPYNVCAAQLQANSSGAEVSGDANTYVDFLCNGFKVRNTSTTWNGNGSTYIYAAFAENPFKNALAR